MQNLDVDTKEYIGVRTKIEKWMTDAERVVERFGLYGIEFGTWMTQYDRINQLIALAVSLRDLAQCLGIAQNKIGLNGELSIALGGRGMGGGAMAHFEPWNYAINLTKEKGTGSLAHEYGHALSRLLGTPTGGDSTAKTPVAMEDDGSLEYLFEKLFEMTFWKAPGELSDYAEGMKGAGDYWNSREEIWARIFAVYIAQRAAAKSIKNKFLVYNPPADITPPSGLVRKLTPTINKVVKIAFTSAAVGHICDPCCGCEVSTHSTRYLTI